MLLSDGEKGKRKGSSMLIVKFASAGERCFECARLDLNGKQMYMKHNESFRVNCANICRYFFL